MLILQAMSNYPRGGLFAAKAAPTKAKHSPVGGPLGPKIKAQMFILQAMLNC
jgi:hypothetical protein